MKRLTLLMVLMLSVVFLSCEKENDTAFALDKSSITLLPNQTDQLTPNVDGCSFKSDNPIVANVATDGLVTSHYVGDTRIAVTNGSDVKYCEVKVQPKYAMYKDPYLVFGSSKATVKANELRTLSEDNVDGLIYKGENLYLLNIIYLFESAKLIGAGCVVPNIYASLLGEFLAERYVFITADVNKNRIYYISPDQDMAVALWVVTVAHSVVAYASVSPSKSAESDIDTVFEKLDSTFGRVQ